MRVLAARIRTGMIFYSKAPFIAFLCLVHYQITPAVLVLREFRYLLLFKIHVHKFQCQQICDHACYWNSMGEAFLPSKIMELFHPWHKKILLVLISWYWFYQQHTFSFLLWSVFLKISSIFSHTPFFWISVYSNFVSG